MIRVNQEMDEAGENHDQKDQCIWVVSSFGGVR